jgi:hypothetical protein
MKLAIRFRYSKPVTPSCNIIELDDEQWNVFLHLYNADKRKDYMLRLMGKEHLDIKELWWIPLNDQDLLHHNPSCR